MQCSNDPPQAPSVSSTPTPGLTPGPPPKPPPSSAHRTYGPSTTNSMFGSRSTGFSASNPVPANGAYEFLPKKPNAGMSFDSKGPGPFRQHTQARQDNIAGKGNMREGFSGTKPTFYPAKEMASDLHPDMKGEHKKRKCQDEKARKKGNNDQESKKVKKQKFKNYHVVLVEGTKAVAWGTYKKLNTDKIIDLGEGGYIKIVELGSSFTKVKIQDAVDATFSSLDHFFAAGWRPLRVKMAGKRGLSSHLRPLNMGIDGLTRDKWEL
ncbi:hypothetical protein FPV67DRAFT_1449252 [Lyophyllum atratum]|nr:hypothetical protein FPV67DRAFT_1449252 [Lyophyllum atratum]